MLVSWAAASSTTMEIYQLQLPLPLPLLLAQSSANELRLRHATVRARRRDQRTRAKGGVAVEHTVLMEIDLAAVGSSMSHKFSVVSPGASARLELWDVSAPLSHINDPMIWLF
jgi:hypothetical protein